MGGAPAPAKLTHAGPPLGVSTFHSAGVYGDERPAASNDGRPVFPKRPWEAVCRAADLKVRPKALRSNWVSYRARLGHPLSTVALEAGHNVTTLIRHYLALTANPPRATT